VKRNQQDKHNPQQVVQLLSVKYLTGLQASGEYDMVSSDDY
jgi:hypothetical protein